MSYSPRGFLSDDSLQLGGKMFGIEVNGLPLISRVIANFHNHFFYCLFIYLKVNQKEPKDTDGYISLTFYRMS